MLMEKFFAVMDVPLFTSAPFPHRSLDARSNILDVHRGLYVIKKEKVR
jgi:hypothetical protein